MCMFRQEFIDNTPKQKEIWPQKDRSTINLQDGVFVLLIDLDISFGRVLLLIICLSSACVNVVLEKSLEEVFNTFHMGIVRADVGFYTVLPN